MRFVNTRPPSFPSVTANRPVDVPDNTRWHVVCGDENHWRAGMYCPAECEPGQITELERHDCPELFLLISGKLTLLVFEEGQVRQLPLPLGQPVLVTAPHAGYCPDGPHTGTAFVVERDSFDTEYRTAAEWKDLG